MTKGYILFYKTLFRHIAWLPKLKLQLVCKILLAIGLIVYPFSFISADNHPPSNIVLIVSDYMGYSDIEPYGAKDIKTPSLNTLAEQGTQFSSHYASAPSCIPSRASLMSGQYPSRVLERIAPGKGLGLRAKNNHLIRELKASNYRTALIGKWHLGTNKNFSPNEHGFDYFLGFDDWTLAYHNHKDSRGEPGLLKNGKLISIDGYLTDIFTQEAIEFIDKKSKDPFFLYLS